MFAKKISMSIFDLLQPISLELAIYVIWQMVFFQISRACQGSPLLRLHRNGIESKHTQVPEVLSPSKTEVVLKMNTLLMLVLVQDRLG